MPYYGWNNSPDSTRKQISRFIRMVQKQLNDNLVGIYLHGSLAMGSFNPDQSDIDLLVITNERIPADIKRNLIQNLLQLSGVPHPIEVSFLTMNHIRPWKFPTPYDLHYSEMWRKRYINEFTIPQWEKWENIIHLDIDLAAHITITYHRGISLIGEPVDRIFTKIPAEDYEHSILSDLKEALDNIESKPVYAILNACRVYAYLMYGRIYSKREAGIWGMNSLSKEQSELIEQALEVYEENLNSPFHEEQLQKFKAYIYRVINKLSLEKYQ